MTTTKTDFNSIKNQDIKAKFVGREVYCNVTSLVEYCLQAGDPDSPVNYDDIENLYRYPEYYGTYADFAGGTEDQRDAEIKRLEAMAEGSTDLKYYSTEIDAEIEALEDLEAEPAEIFEWWAVSSFLFDKLREQGEVVIDTGSVHVWGRQTTGQAILLDDVISRICSDMGILEGQKYEW